MDEEESREIIWPDDLYPDYEIAENPDHEIAENPDSPFPILPFLAINPPANPSSWNASHPSNPSNMTGQPLRATNDSYALPWNAFDRHGSTTSGSQHVQPSRNPYCQRASFSPLNYLQPNQVPGVDIRAQTFPDIADSRSMWRANSPRPQQANQQMSQASTGSWPRQSSDYQHPYHTMNLGAPVAGGISGDFPFPGQGWEAQQPQPQLRQLNPYVLHGFENYQSARSPGTMWLYPGGVHAAPSSSSWPNSQIRHRPLPGTGVFQPRARSGPSDQPSGSHYRIPNRSLGRGHAASRQPSPSPSGIPTRPSGSGNIAPVQSPGPFPGQGRACAAPQLPSQSSTATVPAAKTSMEKYLEDYDRKFPPLAPSLASLRLSASCSQLRPQAESSLKPSAWSAKSKSFVLEGSAADNESHRGIDPAGYPAPPGRPQTESRSAADDEPHDPLQSPEVSPLQPTGDPRVNALPPDDSSAAATTGASNASLQQSVSGALPDSDHSPSSSGD